MKTFTKFLVLIMLCGVLAGCITINVIVPSVADSENTSNETPLVSDPKKPSYTRPTPTSTAGASDENYTRPTPTSTAGASDETYTRPTTSTTVADSTKHVGGRVRR